MKKFSALLICMLLITSMLRAQYIVKGKVADKNNAGAAYATVALLAATDSSIVKGGLTNENGDFQIDHPLKGAYRISVQYVGFAKAFTNQFTLNDTNKIQEFRQITLDDEAANLEEVTVKGQRSLVENKGDRMVLNVANSVIAKGNKVEDLLKYAPLVQSSPMGIKVGNKSNVLILVDGRQTSQTSLTNFLQSFSAEDILKIEVIPNPSAKYDASFGAVINIITKKSLERGFNGRLSLIYSKGEYGRFYPDASVNFRSEKWNVFTSVNGTLENIGSEDELIRKFPGGFMDTKALTNYKTDGLSTFSGIDYTPNKNNTMGIRLNSGSRNSDYTTNMNTGFKSYPARLDSLLDVSRLTTDKTRNYDINFNYTGKLDSAGKELTFNVTKSYFDKKNTQHLIYQERSLEGVSSGDPTRARIRNPKDENNLIAQADLTLPTKRGRWESGLKYIVIGNNNTLTQENEIDGQYTIDPEFSVSGIYKEHSYAAYAGYNNAFKSGWTVQSGLRYENTSQELTGSDVSRQYAGLFPSLGLNKSLKNGDMVNISYARKISRPSLTYLIPYRWLSDPYLVSVGNPNLRPSYEHTIDAGFSKGGLSLFINYTRTKDYISDVIYTDPETRSFVSIPENLKHVNSAYAGLSWNQELFKWWYTNCSVVLNASRTKTPIANIPGVNFSGFGMNSYTNNTFTLPKGYKIELLFIYNSPYRFAIMQNKQVYFMWLSFNKAVLKNSNVKISIQDVFRTQAYRYVTSYGPVYTSTRSYADNQRIRLSFNYNFGKKTVKQAKNRSLGNEAEKSRMGGGVM